MNKHFDGRVLFLSIAVAVIFCDSEYTYAQEKSSSWESTVVAQTNFDFGDVKPGTNIDKVVVLKNDSAKRYEIASISSSCGCMKPKLEGMSIEPGETKELKIKLDTVRFLGRRSASIHVLFAKPADREIKLSAKINIRNLVCEPEEIQFLHSSAKKKEQKRELLVKRVGSPFWQIKSVESSTESVKAELSPSEINGKEVRYKIVCTLKPDPEAKGIQHEKLTLKTNDSSLPSYEIPILIRHSARLEASPKLLDFSNAAIGKKQRLIVKMQSKEEPEFKIDSESGFEIASSKKLNDRTWKLEILKSKENATNTQLEVTCPDWEAPESVRILAETPK